MYKEIKFVSIGEYIIYCTVYCSLLYCMINNVK